MRAATKKRIRELGYSDYDEYLRSPHWIDLRRRWIAKGFPWACFCCGGTNRLVLHHASYDRLGAERLTDLVCLCWSCHRGLHNFAKHHRVKLTHAHFAYKAFKEGRPFRRERKRRRRKR
jgi:hypothetical protein